jgi:hypothetical protein
VPKREWKRIVVTTGPLATEAAVVALTQPYDELYGPKGFALHGIEDTGKGRVVLVYVKG